MTRLSYPINTLVIASLAFAGTGAVGAAEVDVSAEGTVKDDQVVVELFGNAPDVTLYSFGIRIGYDPDQVEPIDAETNGAQWYFGDGKNNKPYSGARILAETSRVLLIGGRLDTESPQAGLGGNEIRLGTVTFTKPEAGTPDLSLGLARTEESFSNFVTTEGRVLDDIEGGISFGTVQFEGESTDTDGDGLPDEWEEEHFGDLSQSAQDNPDGDRLTNEEEFIAGTDPQAGDSVFSLQVALAPEGIRLRWQSSPDRIYSIKVSKSPSGDFETLEDNIEATPPENTYIAPIDNKSTPRFYQISVRRAQP